MEDKQRENLTRGIAKRALSSLQRNEHWIAQDLSLLVNSLPWDLLEDKQQNKLSQQQSNPISQSLREQLIIRIMDSLKSTEIWTEKSLLILFKSLSSFLQDPDNSSKLLHDMASLIDKRMKRHIDAVSIGTPNEERGILVEYLLLTQKRSIAIEKGKKLYSACFPQEPPKQFSNTLDLHGRVPIENCFFLLHCIEHRWFLAAKSIILITGIGQHNRHGKSFVMKDIIRKFFIAGGYKIEDKSPGRLILQIANPYYGQLK